MGVLMTFASSFTLTSAGGDTDIFSIAPIDDHPCRLKRIVISQSSEVAEAQEEDIRFQLGRMKGTFAAGSGGSAVTGVAVKRSQANTNAPTVRMNDTTRCTGAATEVLEESGWNERATPLEWRWDAPEDQYDAVQLDGLFLYMPAAVNDDLTMQCTVIVEVDG